MKRFYTFLLLVAAFFAASAQTVDLEIVGFADNDGNQIYSILLPATQDMQPRVILKNNGPGVVPVTDSVVFDITYNQGTHAAYLVLTGLQVHAIGSGEQVIVDLAHPIWSAATMDEYSLESCTICYEVQIVGTATDPISTNNSACIPIIRDLGIADADAASVLMFPNPASASVTLTGVENAQVQLFDLTGRRVLFIEKATEGQGIDVSSLEEGLYIVRITDGRNSVTKKLNVIR